MSFRWELRAEEDYLAIMLTANNHEQPKNFFYPALPADLLPAHRALAQEQKTSAHGLTPIRQYICGWLGI